MSERIDVLAVMPNPYEGLAAEHQRRADAIRVTCKPSARKSFGSYKPVIVHNPGPWQRTEVVGVRAETRYRVWVDGKPDPKTAFVHYERGETFPTRKEAVARAADEIEGRAQDAMRDASKARERAALARIAPNELHDKAAEMRGRGE